MRSSGAEATQIEYDITPEGQYTGFSERTTLSCSEPHRRGSWHHFRCGNSMTLRELRAVWSIASRSPSR